jgi:phosphoribosylglycinamide formyltransferase-1
LRVTLRVVVLASGTGSLFQALLDAQDSSFTVVGLVTDQPEAQAIGRAAIAGINIAVLQLSDFETRDAWNRALSDAIDYFTPDLVVSAGFMRVVNADVVSRFAGRLINTHPALLPAFPGAHAVRDALAAGVSTTGSTVHFIDAGVDTGEVIAQRSVEILKSDDEKTLHERIKVVERELLVQVVKDFAQKKAVAQ